MTKKYFLPEWTMQILNTTGWTQTELAAHAGLSRTAVNDVVNGKAKGGYKYAAAVAKAANRPIEEGLQAAGIMDIPEEPDEKTKELIHLFGQMAKANKDDTIDYARMKLQQQERDKKKNGKRDKIT